MHFAHIIVVAAVTLTAITALPTTLACLYLLVLTLLSGRPALPRRSLRRISFDVIVPAHDEAAGIEKTIYSLRQLRWPKLQYRIVVVADNCSDATAEIARHAGATVLERHDDARRGKGYALAHAFGWSRQNGFADAIAVVDADSVVSDDLLESFASRIESGECAMQAHYGVLNATDSWRTRLMAIALGSIHKLRSRAREHLHLSCGIRGNGWCVTLRLLDKIPYQSISLTEDIEFGIELGLAGYRVAYCDESNVYGEMVSSAEAASSQRQRWESGRLALIRSKVPSLINAAVCQKSAICVDLALDLLILPLSYVAISVVGVIAASIWHPTGLRAALLAVGLGDFLALCFYVFRGWALSEVGVTGAWDLLRAPAFLAWKLLIVRRRPAPNSWIRTKRERR